MKEPKCGIVGPQNGDMSVNNGSLIQKWEEGYFNLAPVTQWEAGSVSLFKNQAWAAGFEPGAKLFFYLCDSLKIQTIGSENGHGCRFIGTIY